MLEKTLKLRKRGKGLWITIPAAIVRERNLKPGDEALFTQTGENEFELSCVRSHTGAIDKILTFSRVKPPDDEVTIDEANER